MKRIVLIFLVLLILAGCAPNKTPGGNDGKPENVPLEELYNVLKGGKGKWMAYGEKTTESIYVVLDNGKYILHIDQSGALTNSQGNEIKSCSRDKSSGKYMIVYGSDTLNVQVSGDRISAENIYDGNKITEYVYVADEAPHSTRYVLSGKDPSEVITEYLPYVELYSDGTFVFVENVYSGMAEIRGTYVNENGKYTCSITDKSAMQGYAGYELDTLTFHMAGGGLELADNICMSKKGDIFLPEGIGGDKTLLGKYISDTEDSVDEYKPYLELYSDGSFVLAENVYEGMSKIYGTYSIHNGILTCTITDKSTMQGYTGYDLNSISFNVKQTDVYELANDICMSRKGDIFSKEGSTIEKKLINKYISISAESVPEYLPYLELYSDGSFVFRENVYSGLVNIYGTYKESGGKLTCTVSDNSEMQGYTGDTVTSIVFDRTDENTLKLATSINMSQSGHVFTVNGKKESTSAMGKVTVITSNLRIRNKPSTGTDSQVVGHAEKDKTYYVYSVGSSEGYTWYGIGEDRYIAGKEGEWTIFEYFTDAASAAKLDKRFVYNGPYAADTLTEYLPYIELYNDGTFMLKENCFAGMAKVYGTYQNKGGALVCTITDKSALNGFAGYDNDQYTFYYLDNDPKKLELASDICMSRKGDIFILSE